MYEIAFPINNIDKIVVRFQEPLSYVGFMYAVPIIFSQQDVSIIIAQHSTYFNIKDFRDALNNVLHKKLIVHESITKDIGFLSNQYFKDKTGFLIENFANNGEKLELWVGYRYHLWEAYANKKRYVTWMYNDRSGNIILKITPSFSHYNTKERQNFIPFKKWLLRYKPYYTAIIPKAIAQEWYERADMIVKTIDNNVAQWKKERDQTKEGV